MECVIVHSQFDKELKACINPLFSGCYGLLSRLVDGVYDLPWTMECSNTVSSCRRFEILTERPAIRAFKGIRTQMGRFQSIWRYARSIQHISDGLSFSCHKRSHPNHVWHLTSQLRSGYCSTHMISFHTQLHCTNEIPRDWSIWVLHTLSFQWRLERTFWPFLRLDFEYERDLDWLAFFPWNFGPCW